MLGIWSIPQAALNGATVWERVFALDFEGVPHPQPTRGWGKLPKLWKGKRVGKLYFPSRFPFPPFSFPECIRSRPLGGRGEKESNEWIFAVAKKAFPPFLSDSLASPLDLIDLPLLPPHTNVLWALPPRPTLSEEEAVVVYGTERKQLIV